MQTSVTFKNIEASDSLKSYVSEKLDRFDKFLYNIAEASVVLSVEKFRHIAEINIVGDRLNIYGKEETEDMYSAIDMVLDKLEKQIKKSKQQRELSIDILDYMCDAAIELDLNVVQTAFGVKTIGEVMQDFNGISLDTL